MSTHIAVHNLGMPRATSHQLLQTRDKFRGQANDRRKSSRNGKEEYFCEEVNGKRLDDCLVLPLDPLVPTKFRWYTLSHRRRWYRWSAI